MTRQRKVGLAVVFAMAMVVPGFGPMFGPATAEPAPEAPPAAKGPEGPAADTLLDDPVFHAPPLPGPLGLGGSALGDPGPLRAGWGDDRPGIAKVPKYTDQDTLGYTWKDSDMRVWKYQKQGPFEFQIDMGDFANKDQLTKNQKGYWLQLLLPTNVAGIQGYFLVDGDGKFDPFNDPNHDGMGDEPCHPGETWDILKVYVNGRFVHTLQGNKETLCGSGEGGRLFELIPMTQGEPATVFRVPKDMVEKGKNTIKIELLDVPFIHPSRGLIGPDDGWYINVMGAAMQLIAPPLVISGGWSFTPPPGGHEVSNSGWEGDLGNKLTNWFVEYFGQTPWGWDITPATNVNVGTCQQGPGVQSPGIAEYTLRGILTVAKDGKQDFRVSGCEVARMIRDAEGTLGYGYSRGKDPVGFWYIGFSMGGLIGRWALQREGLSGSMAKYVTLGTPHTGSHWADAYVQVMDVKGRYRDVNGNGLREWWGGWKDWANNGVQARYFENNDWQWLPPSWVGSGTLLDHRADFGLKRFGNPLLDGLAIGAGGIADRALAISGQGGTAAGAVASVITANPVVNAIGFLVEGDGVVPTDSATMNGLYNSRMCPAVHHGGVYTYFDSCIFPVFEHFTGFLGTAALGAPTGPAAEDPNRVIPTAELATFAHEITPDPLTGQAGTEDEVRLESSPWSMFTALWPDDAVLRFTLVSPSGVAYTPENAGALGAGYNVEPGLGVHRALWVVPNAEAGVWKVWLNATEDTPAWGTGAVVMVHAESLAELVADAPKRVEPGDAFVVTARLTAAAAGAVVQAHVMPADETRSLHDDGLDGDAVAGDGVFSLRYTDTADEGTIDFDLAATASVQGQAIARSARASVESAQRKAVAVTSLTLDTAQMWWGETARATAVVENLGPGTLDDVTLVWTDDSDNLRVKPLQTHLAVPALDPGESRTVNLDWAPSPGLRTLVAEAWTSGLEEAIEDNRATVGLDVLPSPRTAATLAGPKGLESWYTGPVKVTLGAFDGSPAPYQATLYRVDDGPWTPFVGEFPVAADGSHLLEFYSVDLQGRTERMRSAAFGIDGTAPSAAITKPVLGINVGGLNVPAPVSRPVVVGLVEVGILSSDATSGMARLVVRVDGIQVKEFTDPAAETSWLWDSTASSIGRHTLQVTAYDHAGLSGAASLQVYVTASRAAQVENNPQATLNRVMPPLG